MTHWKPNTEILLNHVPETFNIDDFCTLIKKGVFKTVWINFISKHYRENFKSAVEEMKKTWSSEIALPHFTIL